MKFEVFNSLQIWTRNQLAHADIVGDPGIPDFRFRPEIQLHVNTDLCTVAARAYLGYRLRAYMLG